MITLGWDLVFLPSKTNGYLVKMEYIRKDNIPFYLTFNNDFSKFTEDYLNNQQWTLSTYEDTIEWDRKKFNKDTAQYIISKVFKYYEE